MTERLNKSWIVDRGSWVVGAGFVFGLALAGDVAAQSRVTVVPSISVSSVYDDNLFARQEGDAGEMTQLRPSLEATYESPRTLLSGIGSFDMQRSNHPSLNTLDARRNVYFDSRYRSTPETAFTLAARYDQTETPGELNIESGFLSERQRAWRVQATPGFSHRFGPRATTTGSYDWISERLAGSDQIDLHVLRSNYARRVSTRGSVSGGFVARYFSDVIGAEWSATPLIAYTHDLAFQTQITVQGGPRVSSYSSVAPEFQVGFTRATNRLRVATDYWHGETVVLGIHGPVRLDTATAKFTWPLTRTIEIGSHWGVSDITTLDERRATSYRTTLVGSWVLSGPFIVSGSYGLDFQQGDVRRNLLLEPEVMRHVFRVGLTVAPRLSRQFQEPTGEPGAAPRPRR
jgi:hypothetical protein